jgi:hypothetical protein
MALTDLASARALAVAYEAFKVSICGEEAMSA